MEVVCLLVKEKCHFAQGVSKSARVSGLEALGLSARVCIPGSTVSGLVTLGELPDCVMLHAFICKFGIIIVCAV